MGIVTVCFAGYKSRRFFIARKEDSMAWYSLYKWFRSFRKIPYTDCIAWYRNHLYEEWFSGLTEEEQRKEELRIRKLKEKEDAGFRHFLLAFYTLSGLYSNRRP